MTRWVPVSERLPKGTKIVLLTIPKHAGSDGEEYESCVVCGHYIGGKDCEWGLSDGTTFGYGLASVRYEASPIAWMELPEPYRGEE